MNSQYFKSAAQAHLREGTQRISTCLAMIDDTALWEDPAGHLVSIGNLIKHLIGNVSQYILKGLSGRNYARRREAEFREKPAQTREELQAELAATVVRACTAIEELTDAQLDREYTIQGFTHTGTSAVIHVVEHFSYHVGQITFAAKQKTGQATDYYGGHNLNQD